MQFSAVFSCLVFPPHFPDSRSRSEQCGAHTHLRRSFGDRGFEICGHPIESVSIDPAARHWSSTCAGDRTLLLRIVVAREFP
jgi:hypothetical protein